MNITRLLNEIEQAAARLTACPICHNKPYRVVRIDAKTGAELHETMPETGCLVCGRPVYRTLVVLQGPTPAAPVAPDAA